MSKKLDIAVDAIVKPEAEKLGLEIEYVEYVKEGEINILRIVIDKPGQKVGIEDCESLSRAVDEQIEAKVDIKNEYTLEVASPGIERAIKTDRLYQKYINEIIRFSLYKQVNGKKILIGKIKELNEANLIVVSDEEEYTIEKTNIASANTYYDFESKK
ncbi:MAG: ribosome maturation factor RimP [Clostridia bacterium]